MRRVNEIITGQPAIVSRDALVVDVAKTMDARDLGAVTVCDEQSSPTVIWRWR